MSIDLQRVRQRLEEKQIELETRIKGLTEAHPGEQGPNDATDSPTDFEENAVDFLETQQEQSLMVNAQALLTEVLDALTRIERGTYGICIVCGDPIPEKRLEALPWAARCAKDEEQLEQRNLSQEEFYRSDTY
jgi:DnaK suppressor protein